MINIHFARVVEVGACPAMMRPEKPVEEEDSSVAMVLAVVLHGFAICTAIVGVVLTSDRETFEQSSLLLGNDPPGRFVGLGVVYILCLIAFAVISAMDVCNYQLRSMAVTGIGLAFGGVCSILGGVFCVVASLALSAAAYWLFLLAFFSTAIVYALQCAGIITGLLRDLPMPR